MYSVLLNHVSLCYYYTVTAFVWFFIIVYHDFIITWLDHFTYNTTAAATESRCLLDHEWLIIIWI